jgi:hypothetical protein
VSSGSPRAELGTSTLAISQSVIAFTAFLPNFVEVGKSDKKAIEGQVRLGETAAVVIALSIGALLSWLSQSPFPFMISSVMSFVLISLYEVALRQEM